MNYNELMTNYEPTHTHTENRSKYSHFLSPAENFVFVASNFEPLASLFHPHHCYVGEADLVSGCEDLPAAPTHGCHSLARLLYER